MGDRANNQIHFLNAITGAVSQTYQLTGAPNEMVLDQANSLLYASLQSSNILARVDLSSGSVTNIALANPVNYLCMGPSGKVFAEDYTNISGGSVTLELVDGLGGLTLALYPNFPTAYLAFDSVHSSLLVGQYNNSAGNLLSFNFDNTSNTLSAAQTQATNNFINGISISPDNNHLGVMESSSGVVDFNPVDFTATFGSWAGGIFFQAGDFSPDSASFVTGIGGLGGTAQNMGEYVYSTTTHSLSGGVTFISSNYFSFNRVGFSKGGRVIYALTGNYPDSYMLFWFRYP